MATHVSEPTIAPPAMTAATPMSATRLHSGHDRWRGRQRHSGLERALERQPDVADGLHPLPGILLQAAPEVGAQHGRERRRQPGPVRLTLEDARQRVRYSVSIERPLPREHLVEHTAERPDIRACVDRLPTRLLWAHVGRGPENHAGLGTPAR